MGKERMRSWVRRRFQRGWGRNSLRDDLLQVKSAATRRVYLAELRPVVAQVQVCFQKRVMEFLTRHLD